MAAVQSIDEEAIEAKAWPPRSNEPYDWNLPSNEAYADIPTHHPEIVSQFEVARTKLDYTYHRKPVLKRQQLQDFILDRVLTSVVMSPTARQPWIVFTAGAMGAGKSYVLSQLFEKKLFPLEQFVKIDPDMLKSEIPEMAGYLEKDPETAATKLHRESTQMSDVLFEHALQTNHNILVDGSLRDVDWYTILFARLRRDCPSHRLGILYVSASPEVIRARAKDRAERTGRAVPEDLLQGSIDQVPRSVGALSPLTDITYEVTNNDGQPLDLVSNWPCLKRPFADTGEIPKATWKDFAQSWSDSRDEEGAMEHDMVCRMAGSFTNTKDHDVARGVWSRAYPNLCVRCTLHHGDLEGVCGLCVHEVHLCSCKICKWSSS